MHIYIEEFDSDKNSKEQHELGHNLLRFVLQPSLGRLTKAQWCDMLSYEAKGKPYLSEHPDIYFNLSHTSGLVVVATGDHPVGIDAEEIRPYPSAILRKMTEKERDYLQAHDNSHTAFMRIWTMKEAYIKLTGEGLSAFEKIECIPGRAIDGIAYRQFVWHDRFVVTAMELKSPLC